MNRIEIELSEEERRNYGFDTEYVVAEDKEVGKLYERGYLPAFLPPAKDMRLFYLAPRSLRVNLKKFELSSENRRILKKTSRFDHVIYHVGAIHKSSFRRFEYDPIRVGKFCKDYFDEKFGRGVMSVSRIKRIFSAPMTTNVWVYYVAADQSIHLKNFSRAASRRIDTLQREKFYKSSSVYSASSHLDKRGSGRVGYVTCYIDNDIFNYTFAFYDLNYYKDNLGIRMMLDSVMWAKENGKNYIYLGSVRDSSGLYKTQFRGWEYFDGSEWSVDKDELKQAITSKTGNQ